MKILLEIDDPKELEKFSKFVQALEVEKATEKTYLRKKVLGELFKQPRIHLPSDYKFNREEAHERKGFRH